MKLKENSVAYNNETIGNGFYVYLIMDTIRSMSKQNFHGLSSSQIPQPKNFKIKQLPDKFFHAALNQNYVVATEIHLLFQYKKELCGKLLR